MEEASGSELVAYIKVKSGIEVWPPLRNSESLGIAGSCHLYRSENHRQTSTSATCHLPPCNARVPTAAGEYGFSCSSALQVYAKFFQWWHLARKSVNCSSQEYAICKKQLYKTQILSLVPQTSNVAYR